MRKFVFLLLLTCLPIWSIFSQTLNDSLIVYYPLDGNADDFGPNNLDGSYFAVAAADCAGSPSGATYFDGINDHIAFPNDTLLKPQLPISISFRIKLNQYHSFGHILGTDGYFNTYRGIWFNLNQNRIVIAYGSGNGASPQNRRTKIGNLQLNVNQWHTITTVIAGPKQFTLYVNCQEDMGTYSGSGGSISYSNLPGDLGRNATVNGFEYFKGYLDEFKMWNRTLNANEIMSISNNYYCYTDSIKQTICQGDSLSINKIKYYKTTGIYTDTLFGGSVRGCDSVVHLNLTVNLPKYSFIKQSICAGEIFNFNGKKLASAGVYSDTLVASNFCDSIITLNLSVLPQSSVTLDESICDDQSFNFNGNILTSAGVYVDTLTAANGCDSIITLNLDVLPRSFTPLQTEICQGDTFDFNGSKLTATGIYSDTLVAANLCDSIVTLDLTVKPLSDSTINVSICNDDFYFFDGKNLNSSGTYLDTLQAANSCDSVITLNLTVNPTMFNTINTTICKGDVFDFNGTSITTDGTYLDTLLSSTSCDSIITLNLSVLPQSTNNLNKSICDNESFNFNGNILTSAGVYVDTLTAANGCDSIITLNLDVLPRSFTPLQTEICQGDTFDFNGSKLTATGIYFDTLVAANSCDSIITLDLNVKPHSYTTIYDSIFSNGSFFFNGKNITKAGIYIDTSTAFNACDSIITLYLSIKYPTGSITKEICPGDTITIDDSSYSETGFYIDTLSGAAFNGADSLVYITIENISLEECYPLSLEIPNVFTPNNDGVNDIFMVRGENITSYNIEIYNRWGQLIYSSTNIRQIWDGRYNGNKCAEGNYFYHIQCIGANGEKLRKKGNILLNR